MLLDLRSLVEAASSISTGGGRQPIRWTPLSQVRYLVSGSDPDAMIAIGAALGLNEAEIIALFTTALEGELAA